MGGGNFLKMANKILKLNGIWFLLSLVVLTLVTVNVYAANSWRDAQTFADLPSSVDLTTMSEEEYTQFWTTVLSLIDAELTRSSDRKYEYFVSANREVRGVRIDFFPLIDGLCGNSVCDAGEDFMNCLTDCPTSNCGNSVCDAGETSISCPPDCGTIINNYPSTDTPYTIPSTYDAYGNSIPTTTADTPYTAPTTYNNPAYSTGYKAPPNPMNCGNGICDLGDQYTMPEDSYSCPTDCSQQDNPITGMVVGNLLTGFWGGRRSAVQDPSACSDQCKKLAEATGHNPNNPKIKRCNVVGSRRTHNFCCKADEDCVSSDVVDNQFVCCSRGSGRRSRTGLAYCGSNKEDCKQNGWPEGGILPNPENTPCGAVVKCCGPGYKCSEYMPFTNPEYSLRIPRSINICVPEEGECQKWCRRGIDKICCPSPNDICVDVDRLLPDYRGNNPPPSVCSATDNDCSSRGGTICQGLIAAQQSVQYKVCCPTGYNCANQPDGQPRCVKPT